MKREINRLIVARIVEIVFVIAFIVVSLPLWQNMGDSNLEKITYSKTKLNFTGLSVENPIAYTMYPMRKSEAIKKLKATKLIVSNESLTSEDYTLSLKVSKNSTLNYNCLNISIDNKVMPLNSLTIKEDSTNYYFVIAEGTIKGDTKEYSIKLWMDENICNEMQNKELTLSYELIKSVTKI